MNSGGITWCGAHAMGLAEECCAVVKGRTGRILWVDLSRREHKIVEHPAERVFFLFGLVLFCYDCRRFSYS